MRAGLDQATGFEDATAISAEVREDGFALVFVERARFDEWMNLLEEREDVCPTWRLGHALNDRTQCIAIFWTEKHREVGHDAEKILIDFGRTRL